MRRIFFQCHFAIMGMNDGLAERKPKPKTSAAVANRIAPGKKHFKNTFLQFIRDTGTIIADAYFGHIFSRDCRDLDVRASRSIFDCVVHQIDKHLHDETVVLLSHKKPDGHINVKVEFGEGEGKVPLDNIAKRAEEYKPKERVTYKMIKEYIEAKYGFKVHTAYIAEVKRDLGLPMYDAPNAVEELKQPRKHPTAEKVEAIKDALKYYKMI